MAQISGRAQKKRGASQVSLFRTSMRNFGLSGMNSLMMRADERLGMEQRTTNNLQLWKSTKPREKWVQVFGITNQARPANRDTVWIRDHAIPFIWMQGITVSMIHDTCKDKKSGIHLVATSVSFHIIMTTKTVSTAPAATVSAFR